MNESSASRTHAAPGAEIKLEGAVNFRELGGYRAADGRHLRYGLLYRGANLSLLSSPADQATLNSWGLKEVLDLRSAGESDKEPDPVPAGCHYQRVCGMRHADGSEMDFSPAGIRRLEEEKIRFETAAGRKVHDFEWFCVQYAAMPFGNPAYHELFRLLEEERVPLLFHCSCGKDRTGIAAILILLALGVDRKTALKDYLLTNVYRRDFIKKSLEGKPPAEYASLVPVEGVSRRMGSGAVDAIEARYPSYEAFFEAEFGLDAARLNRLRDFYLE